MSTGQADVVVGAGSWGTTLAISLARQHPRVVLIARTAAEADQLRAAGENQRFLPGIPFPATLTVSADLNLLKDARSLTLAVPSETMEQALSLIQSHFAAGTLVINGSKGLAPRTPRRLSELIAEALQGPVCVMSGPNLAREVARQLPTSTVVASADAEAARLAQELFNSKTFRVYTSSDVVGVELAGALKNVIALAAGAADGLNVGDNGKAALMTRGLAEISRLGVALGADPLTFAGLAGVGDLIATCASPLSRNRRLGERLASGAILEDAQRELGQVAEGVPTTQAAVSLARKHGVELPIAEQMHAILFEGKNPRDAVLDLMQREPKAER